MGFINNTLESFKTAVRPKLDWKGGADNLSKTFSKDRETAVIASEIDDQEFKARYRNVQLAAWSSTLFFAISILVIPFSSSYKDFVISAAAAVLFMLFYLRYAYMLWVCRTAWQKGIDLDEKVSSGFGDFYSACIEDLSEAAPLALPKKGARK